MLPKQPFDKQHARTSGRVRQVLLVRSNVARAFGTLGSFAAMVFLGAGIYLLQEELSDPLRAEGMGLIGGAFVIALATILIYFIFAPRTRLKGAKAHRHRHSASTRRDIVIPAVKPVRLEVEEASEDWPLPVS